MLKSYFKTAWRNLLKNRIFSLINIAGLAVAQRPCLLILQYMVRVELWVQLRISTICTG